MATPNATVDELDALLRRSSLPTLVVEGRGDAVVWRHVEDVIGNQFGIDVLQCGGRDCVLELFRRRAFYTHIPIAFLADSDMWIFEGKPSGLEDLITTQGYSIENDVLVNSGLERLVPPADRVRHSKMIDIACELFAFEVECFMKGDRRSGIVRDLHDVLDHNTEDIKPNHKNSIGFVMPSADLLMDIRENYEQKLRGRVLLQCLVRALQSTSRGINYGKSQLLHLALVMGNDTAAIDRIVAAALNQLVSAKQGEAKGSYSV